MTSDDMVHRFAKWVVLEARAYSQENFQRIVSNIDGWLAGALDPQFPAGDPAEKRDARVAGLRRALSVNPSFRRFMSKSGLAFKSSPSELRAAASGFGKFLNDIEKKDSDELLALLKKASGSWKWHQLTKEPGKKPGKRGRPPGSKNRPKERLAEPQPAAAAESPRPARVRRPVTPASLARALGVTKKRVVAMCAQLGHMVTGDTPLDELDADLIDLIADEAGRQVEVVAGIGSQLSDIQTRMEERRGDKARLEADRDKKEEEMERAYRAMVAELKEINRRWEENEDEIRELERRRSELEAQASAQQEERPRRGRPRKSKPAGKSDWLFGEPARESASPGISPARIL